MLCDIHSVMAVNMIRDHSNNGEWHAKLAKLFPPPGYCATCDEPMDIENDYLCEGCRSQ